MFLQLQNTPLNEAWRIQYGADSLDPDVFPAYMDWLLKMQTYTKDDIAFILWDKKIAETPAIGKNEPRVHSPRGEQR